MGPRLKAQEITGRHQAASKPASRPYKRQDLDRTDCYPRSGTQILRTNLRKGIRTGAELGQID